MVVRTDEQLDYSFRDSSQWKIDIFKGERSSAHVEQPDGSKRITSLSGYERNVLFLNDRGQRFLNLSSVSGADNIADGRTFVIWDYNRDGWQDMAIVNANSPLLSIYRNEVGELDERGNGQMIALQFVGGNRTGQSTPHAACRDGYGVKVTVKLDGQELLREHRCGEGFAGQNSATMVVGMGVHRVASLVEVRWPAGRVQRIENVAAGTLLTVHEDPEELSDGAGFVSEPYRRPATRVEQVAERDAPTTLQLNRGIDTSSRLSMYTTMATWCDACKSQLPQLSRLRDRFHERELSMVGVPIDGEDDADKLDIYRDTYQPAYQLLTGLDETDRREITAVLREATDVEALPSTVVTDMSGQVLKAFVGVPTVSELKDLLHTQEP